METESTGRNESDAPNHELDSAVAPRSMTPPRASIGTRIGLLVGAGCCGLTGAALTSFVGGPQATRSPLLVTLSLLALWALLHSRRSRRWLIGTLGLALVAAAIGLTVRQTTRYQTAEVMLVPLREYSNAEYPEDPANRSVRHGQYTGRRLKLVRQTATHFDFVFEPQLPHIATVTFRNVDVSLMTPALPEWCKREPGNTRIALTDRQWNRQQVSFPVDGQRVEVSGGDGFEKEKLYSAELAKNCLNAGLWEVLLFEQGSGGKELYYQGWFTFPLGLYRELFEAGSGLKFGDHWYYLEHWFDPAGTVVQLDELRRVTATVPAKFAFDPHERLIAGGEQQRKRRTLLAPNVTTWADFTDGHDVRFAAFIPPGRYSVQHPWKNEYHRLTTLKSVTLRDTQSPVDDAPLQELELLFEDRAGQSCRFFVSGFRWDELPQLATAEYAKGLYMPMGIGVPPFFQSVEALSANPPHKSAYFSVLLDAHDCWIDHHKTAIDGPILHRDAADPNTLHLYLLSYERHSLITHLTVTRRIVE